MAQPSKLWPSIFFSATGKNSGWQNIDECVNVIGVRTRSRIAYVSCLIVILGGFAFYVLRARPQEPVYQGKPLSVWLEYCADSNLAFAHDVDGPEGIRHIGTDALPTLLRMVRATDSPAKLKLFSLLAKQHLFEVKYIPAETLNYQGMCGFRALGTNARNAVPRLIAIYEARRSRSSEIAAARSLGGIGPMAKQAVPSLLRGLGSTDRSVHLAAIEALGEIHSQSQLVLPALATQLTNNDSRIREAVIFAAAEFRAEPQLSLPILIDGLKDDNWEVSLYAMKAVIKLGPEAKPMVPKLVELIKQPKTMPRVRADEALRAIDPDAEIAALEEAYGLGPYAKPH